MTGLPDHNFPAFNAAAEQLRALGYDVVNPAEINVDKSLSWEACLREDVKALCDCDILALLPGWEGSKGAHLEVHIAHRLGIEVVSFYQIGGALMTETTQHVPLEQLRNQLELMEAKGHKWLTITAVCALIQKIPTQRSGNEPERIRRRLPAGSAKVLLSPRRQRG
jgi:hypothetical protein